MTRDNSRINLTVALSYGGRAEIVAAARAIARQGRGRRPRRRRDRRGVIRPPPVYRGTARPGPVDPHQRRAAHQQLSAVAVRLCRVRLYQDAVAGFRSKSDLRAGDRRILRPRAPLRGLRWIPLTRVRGLAERASGSSANNRLAAILSALVLAPVAVAASGSAGPGCRS